MKLFTKHKQTLGLQKQIHGYQRGKVGGQINSEFGINRYTLLLKLQYLSHVMKSWDLRKKDPDVLGKTG